MRKHESDNGQRLVEWKVDVPLLVAGVALYVLACWGMIHYRFFYHPLSNKLMHKEMVANLMFWALPSGVALVRVNIPIRYNTLSRCILMAVGILGGFITFNLTSWQIVIPQSLKFCFPGLVVSAALFMLLWLLVWDVRIVAPLGCTLWMVIGYAYRCVYLFRGTPFTPADVFSVGTGLAVAENYSFAFVSEDMAAVAIVLIVIRFVSWIPVEKPHDYRLRMAKGACVALNVGAIVMLLFTTVLNRMGAESTAFLSSYPTVNKKQSAMTTCMYEWWVLLTEKPIEYKSERLAVLADEVQNYTDVVSVGDKMPNVIVMMNESLCDPISDLNLETTEEVLPFLHSFGDESLHGELFVSVLGGDTCDTEHGFLTGTMPVPGIKTPLLETVKNSTPSIGWLFKSLGYSTVVMHPENKKNYQRDVKYPLLGFDEFFAIEDYKGMELYRDKISDRACCQKIIERYEQRKKEERLFIFNVTYQNHGGYAGGEGNTKIELARRENVEKYWQAEEYLNSIRESDRAIAEMIAYFQQQEEPVVILIFGDHQPKLAGVTGMPHKGEQVQDVLHDFRTPFYIWANYPIETGDYGSLSVNYLSALFLKTAGISMEPYNAWCLNIAEEYPIVTIQGYADTDGRFHSWSDGEWPQALIDMNVLRYNRLYDAKNRLQGLDVGVPD